MLSSSTITDSVSAMNGWCIWNAHCRHTLTTTITTRLTGLNSGVTVVNLRLEKVEHGVIMWPDEKEPLTIFEDCGEALATCMLAGGGFVVSRATYVSDWMPHDVLHAA